MAEVEQKEHQSSSNDKDEAVLDFEGRADDTKHAENAAVSNSNVSRQSSISSKKSPHPKDESSSKSCDESQEHLPPDIPKNILTFRTITTMLDKMQRVRKRNYESSKSWNVPSWDIGSQERDKARLSSAFAKLAAIDEDAISLVTRRFVDKIEIIAFIQDKSLASTQCRDAKAIPIGLEDADEAQVLGYLEAHCSKDSPVLETPTRLWILNKLFSLDLPQPNQGGLTPFGRVLHYVVTTLHEKIMSRFKFGTPSPYLESLKSVTDFAFKDCPLQDLSTQALENDRIFLTQIGGSIFAEEFRTLFPNIFVQIDLAKQQKSFQFYTKDTYKEFHSLLILLLDRLYRLLQCMRNGAGHDGASNQEDGAVSKQEFRIVKLLGYYIWTLTTCAAMEMHLKTISPSLSDQRRINIQMLTSQVQDNVDPENISREYAEASKAFRAFQPSTGVGMQRRDADEVFLQKSYLDWLKSIVFEFDAAWSLTQYIGGRYLPHKNFSFQILVSLPADKALLSWRELLTDARITSNLSVRQRADIFQFLDTAVRSNCLQSSRWIESAKKSWVAGDLEKTIEGIRNVQCSTLPSWRNYAIVLLRMLQDKQTLESETGRSRISVAMDSLCGVAQFLSFLHDLDNQVAEFTGSLHCEAYLSSLLQHFKDDSPNSEIMEFGRVIGIQQRCCPTCRHLLELLRESEVGIKFLINGSDCAVTACTLPTWLPTRIVDSMNLHFGRQLSQELFDLTNRSGFGNNDDSGDDSDDNFSIIPVNVARLLKEASARR